MFVLKKLITPFVLPPGIIVLAALCLSGILLFRKRWWTGILNLTVGLSLWALSTSLVANHLMVGLERNMTIPSQPVGDVLILLGGGIINGVPDLTGVATPSPQMMGRVVTAVRLYRKLKLPIIVTGGKEPYPDAVAEAFVIRRFLVDLGVPESQIIVEDKARDTVQNAQFSADICQRRGFHNPILLTSAYHLMRSHMAFKAVGLRVTPFPGYFTGVLNPPFSWHCLLPKASSLYNTSKALHEYLGIIFYRLGGMQPMPRADDDRSIFQKTIKNG